MAEELVEQEVNNNQNNAPNSEPLE